MKQISFSEIEFAGKKRTKRRETFLAGMGQVVHSVGGPDVDDASNAVVTNLFQFRKVRCKGLAKNMEQLHILFDHARPPHCERPVHVILDGFDSL